MKSLTSKYTLNDHELDWILAGLRLLEGVAKGNLHVSADVRAADIMEIASERRVPTPAEIDKLCVELNTHQRSEAIRPDADEIVERKSGSLINGPREPIPEAVVDDLRDALSEILEEVGLKIPVSLRDRGIKACQAHERYL